MAASPKSGTAMSEYGDLPPHPLVCGLAIGVKSDGTFADAKKAADYSLSLRGPHGGPPTAATVAEPSNLSTALASFPGPGRAQVVMFAGYLGPRQAKPGDRNPWRLLYQDAKATTWLLLPENGIVLHHRARDRKAAFGLRDIIWVKADTPVRQGDEGESKQARFLVGSFTSAGDLHASLLVGGSYGGDSGILCAPTPLCCGPHTH